MAYYLEHFPPTKEGEKLKLLQEKKNYLLVYKIESENGDYYFHNIWQDGDSYDENYIVVPLNSSFVGLEEVTAGTHFVNVIGSSNDKYDPDKGKAWIRVMEDIYDERGLSNIEKQKLGRCSARNDGFIDPNSNARIPSGHPYTCGGRIVGGHILLNKKEATTVRDGGNFVLLPICDNHNTKHLPNFKVGAGYYMKTSEDIYGLSMTNFHPKKAVRNYFEQYSIENIAVI